MSGNAKEKHCNLQTFLP